VKGKSKNGIEILMKLSIMELFSHPSNSRAGSIRRRAQLVRSGRETLEGYDITRPTRTAVKDAMIKRIGGKKSNKGNIRHQARKVRPALSPCYSSVDLFVGGPSGKTFWAMNDIINISFLQETHLIIYVFITKHMIR
jgi:hypothetical protein